ncbi:MAG TPA: hypothetical protein DDW90_06660 [Cyanobacteria bacterium UBA9971]|nr:hypothetical protein [Cyanobacteria bacterium UBA9971]
MNKNANIIEIFSSIQGEGPYIGYRQIFIRFAGCNLSCDYCDTPFQAQEFCNIQKTESSEKLKNPVSVEQLLKEISNFNKISHHSISLTGGEPLLHTDFLLDFLSDFRKNFPKTKVYLETNGTLFEELEKIIDYIDIISMDLKLKSSTGIDFPFEQHKKFIEIARDCHVGTKVPPRNDNFEIFAKAVITSKISDEEIEELSDFIKIPLILQPVSSDNKEILLSSRDILEIQEKFLKKLGDVRVIPQVHKFLDLL